MIGSCLRLRDRKLLFEKMMNEQTNKRTNEQMNKRTNEQMNKWTKEQTDERRNRLKTILTRFKEQNKQHFEKQTQIGITLKKYEERVKQRFSIILSIIWTANIHKIFWNVQNIELFLSKSYLKSSYFLEILLFFYEFYIFEVSFHNVCNLKRRDKRLSRK